MLPHLRHLLLILTVLCLGAVPKSSMADLLTVFIPPSNPAVTSDPIILAAGDLFEMEYANDVFTMEVTIDGQTAHIQSTSFSSSGASLSPTVPKIMGPAEIRIPGSTSQPYLVTFKVTRANESAVMVPSTAVVIPEDAEGEFQVILESSTDTITWTPALPGSYGGSTQKRFFRTRIVKNS